MNVERKKKQYTVGLTIAGSDCSGGAGIQADIKTFSALGVYAASAITAIVAENTQGVQAIESVSPALVKQQIISVFDDIQIHAVKIGMLHSCEIIQIVAECLDLYKPKWVVLDPVMIATSGDLLIEPEAANLIKEILFSRSSLITPNIDEAQYLTGMSIENMEDMKKAGTMLLQQGCNHVLMKGGHLKGNTITDILISSKGQCIELQSSFIDTSNMHGTGCTLSSAIAAYLALGYSMEKAVHLAKIYITNALEKGKEVHIGKGNGPVNHFFDPLPYQLINLH